MKNRIFLIIIVLFFLFSLNIVYSEEAFTTHVAYCVHSGYKVDLNEDKVPICIFDDKTNCTTWDFYTGVCGQNKVKPSLEPRKEGEFVYIEFEKCEEGLIPGKQEYLLEPPKCIRPNKIKDFFDKIWDLIF